MSAQFGSRTNAGIPQVEIFRMIASMASTTAPSKLREFIGMLSAVAKMLPISRLKVAMSDKIQDLRNGADPLSWVYMLESSLNMDSRTPTLDWASYQKLYDPVNISKPFWGIATWRVLHWLALNDNQTDDYRRAYTALASSLQFLLPCERCRAHVSENLSQVPISLFRAKNNGLFQWSNQLHNLVNQQLGKPEISLEQAYQIHL